MPMHRARFRLCLLILALPGIVVTSTAAEPPETNYDESKVPAYTLPDPLVRTDGARVDTPEDWNDRREEILELFRSQVYGRAPKPPEEISFEVVSIDTNALNGDATRKDVRIHLGQGEDHPILDLLIYLPNQVRFHNQLQGPIPIFFGLNFAGNHTIHEDPGIPLARFAGIKRERGRGSQKHRWAIKRILDAGYGLATIHCSDIDPDFNDGFANGVHELDTKPRTEESWATICAWAWGLSRGMDYFQTDGDIDHTKVALIGHSRLGKTALWACARDPRFAMAISNNSGCGGAALSARRYGETIAFINNAMPHWFCENYKRYNDNEAACPVDQHMLLALIAPRPVYVASALKDRWADPKGEFLSARHADPVYRLLGTEGIASTTMPNVDEPITGTIGYHIRSGGHDVTDYDWEQYLAFAKKHFSRTTSP